MKVLKSEFLSASKPLLKKLVHKLSEQYGYVSVLGTDTKGKSFRVSRTGIEVNDYIFTERGFVVRIHNGVNYSEYSFNEINEDKFNSIIEDIHHKLNKLADGIKVNSYKIIEEEELDRSFLGEVDIDPEQISPEQVVRDLTAIRDAALKTSDLLVNFHANYSYIHVSKIFISAKKDLEQSYILGEGLLNSIARREDKVKYFFAPVSGMRGYEVVRELQEQYPKVIDQSIRLLDSKTVVPGEYEVVCSPDIAGLIAHEAFGHGVEMDMFVKGRAKGAEYLGKQVASIKTTLHEGAAAAWHMSSYLFDDEGTLGTDTTVIKEGILQTGISDLLSALQLGTVPTGNGKRETFERKAYARMTNTFFAAGTDRYEDMIASVQKGYLIEGMYSGMEDPKNWGIQCIALVGSEIIDGKLTGNLISPVIMTGYVPEVLNSISMVSEEVFLDGVGYCGKGHKELVKTANGGPYIKTKVRLG